MAGSNWGSARGAKSSPQRVAFECHLNKDNDIYYIVNKSDLAYLQGLIKGDGYIYKGKRKGIVVVITQKNKEFLREIEKIIEKDKINAWIFKQRGIFVLETKHPNLFREPTLEKMTKEEKIHYISGFFDADGGIPRYPENLPPVTPYYYVQFVQKDKDFLEKVKSILENDFDINCGKIHQYDKNKNVWRFFIKSSSLLKFLKLIKSRHPEKKRRIETMKRRLLQR